MQVTPEVTAVDYFAYLKYLLLKLYHYHLFAITNICDRLANLAGRKKGEKLNNNKNSSGECLQSRQSELFMSDDKAHFI